jgi:hypothetical protein
MKCQQSAKAAAKRGAALRQPNAEVAPTGSSVDQQPIMVRQRPGEDQATTFARASMDPSVGAAAVIGRYSIHMPDPDLTALMAELASQIDEVRSGSMRQPEAMLMGQAQTLQAIFNRLALTAMSCSELDAVDIYLRLALRAQGQCRATLETLTALKNPPQIAYVGQANIAQGPQQVTNVVGSNGNGVYSASSRNEVLEDLIEDRLDGC